MMKKKFLDHIFILGFKINDQPLVNKKSDKIYLNI